MTGATASWHWTYALVILYGLIAMLLFFYRRWLLKSRSACVPPTAGKSAFHSQVKARFGQPAVLLLALTLIFIFIGADQAGAPLGPIFDGAGLVLLTVCCVEMRIYPWSPAWITIGADLHPVLSNAFCKPLTADWAASPTFGVVSLDHVAVTGPRLSRQPGSPPAVQRLDIYRFDLGDKAFEQLLVFLKQTAHVQFAVKE
jgi:hypothetical protein